MREYVSSLSLYTMEKQQLHDKHEDPPPPYAESERPSTQVEKPTQKSLFSPVAPDRVADIRRQRVRLLIDGHIGPLLEDAILNRKHTQTIILVPSQVFLSTTILTISNLVHRPRSVTTNIIQLTGPNSTGPLWTQPQLAQDLEEEIRTSLQSMTGASQATTCLPARPALPSNSYSGQQSWLKRTFGMPGPDHDPTGSTGQWVLGWRSEAAESPRVLGQNEFALSVKVKDVAWRTETEMGLFTTSTVECVVIEVERNPWDSSQEAMMIVQPELQFPA